MSGGRLIFIDALMELGIEEASSPGTEAWYGSRKFGDATQFDRWSSVDVRLYRTIVEVVWNHFILSGDEYGVEVHTFRFPMEWVETLTHVKQVLRLAEHKLETGETLPIERSVR